MRWSWMLLFVLTACPKVVKTEGFRAQVTAASQASLVGAYAGDAVGSCGRYSPSQVELHLVGDGFVLDAVTVPGSPNPSDVAVVIDGARYVADRPGGSFDLAVDNPGGRIVGSFTATLIHESAGTVVDGRPAPVLELAVDLTFNLQPCP